jgi:CRISPR system Cascade subunit CasB
MTTTTSSTYLTRQTNFLESLHSKIKNDNGAKAALKRALSDEERHIRNTYSIILPHIPDIKEYQQKTWIFVACLSVYYPQVLDREDHKNFGYSCRGLAQANNSEGTERRFRALLDTTTEDLQSPLTSLVRQIKSKDIRLDYPQLLSDLCRWDYPDQYVQIQDRWARTFWGASSTDDQQMVLSATQLSEPAFAQIWNNPEDAAYDNL